MSPTTRVIDGVDSRQLAIRCAQLLDEKKLVDIEVVDVKEALQITDFFVIASGLNSRHLQTSSVYLSKELRQEGLTRSGQEGQREGKWILLDFDHVVVHLFLDEARKYYDLELLWGDSPKVTGWQVDRPSMPGAAPDDSDAARGESEGEGETSGV